MLSKIMVIAAIALAACDAHKKQDIPKPVAAVPEVAKPTTAIGPAPPAADAATAPAPGAAVEVSASDLMKDYKSDNISADDKYRNRILRVTGTVSRVDKDALEQDDPGFVQLAAPPGEVQARMDPAATKSLRRGQKITLRCTGKGFEMEMPFLDDCTIEK